MKESKASIIVLSASARSLAESAIRGGYGVEVADFFADWDTREFLELESGAVSFGTDLSPKAKGEFQSRIAKINRFPDVVALPSLSVPRKIVLAGGAETDLDLVDQLSICHQLIGCSSSTLRRLQNEVDVFSFLRKAGFNSPVNVTDRRSELLADFECSRWIQKKAGSSSGLGVRDVDSIPDDLSRNDYLQRVVGGEPYSAVFFSLPLRGNETALLGASKQIVGSKKLHARKYSYCGSLGPWNLASEVRRNLVEIANTLSREFKIAGVWGIDFFIDGSSIIPVDINARPTASCELFESTIAKSEIASGLFDLHVRCCSDDGSKEANKLVGEDWSVGHTGFAEGKAILFNGRLAPLQVNDRLLDFLVERFDRSFYGSDNPGSTLADIPVAGTVIEPIHPVLTVRVRAENLRAVENKLWHLVSEVEDEIGMNH